MNLYVFTYVNCTIEKIKITNDFKLIFTFQINRYNNAKIAEIFYNLILVKYFRKSQSS